jgi:hypothetical protein
VARAEQRAAGRRAIVVVAAGAVVAALAFVGYRHRTRGAARVDVATARLVERSPITGRPVDNIEEFVAALPADVRSHFTLVHQSRSPHGGLGDKGESSIDVRFPRVLLYSSDGKLVVAFTTNPDKPGYDVAEILRFVDAGARFELSRFILPQAVRKDPSLAEAARRNGEVDPPECLRCHGTDVRPILDSYPLWPGFFGAVADTFPEEAPELPGYRDFLAKNKDRGLFKSLIWPTGSTVPPYIDPHDYDSKASVGRDEDLPRAPNSVIGMALNELNRKRIERKLAASPLYPKLRYAMIAVLLGCEQPPLGAGDLEPVRAAIVEDNAGRIDRLGYHPKGPEGSAHLDMAETLWPENVAELLYVARALGVSPRDFSMALEDGALAFYDGILSGRLGNLNYYVKEDWLVEMLRRLARDEPDFAEYFHTYEISRGRFPFGERLDLRTALRACGPLLERQRAVNGYPPRVNGALASRPPHPPEEPSPEELRACAASAPAVGRCTRCHEGEDAHLVGRPIPLSNPGYLALRLDAKCAGSSRTLFDEILARMRDRGPARMPPHGDPPTEREVAEMRRYLEAARKAPRP